LEILVPANKCGLVIGKGGETIKRLSEQYGVKLVVIQDASTTSGTDKPLRITGDPEKVARAKEAVLALINPQVHKGPSTNEYGSKNILPGQTEVYIKVPSEKAGIVIGKGTSRSLHKPYLSRHLIRAHSNLILDTVIFFNLFNVNLNLAWVSESAI
jgi:far upstream element-binding protein